MKIDDLKEKIAKARKAVEDEEEPFRTAAFTVILDKLMDQNTMNEQQHKTSDNPQVNNPTLSSHTVVTSEDIEGGKRELAKVCGISVKELEEVLSFNKGTVQVIAPIYGKETNKQIIATQCILLAHEVALGVEWVSSSVLRKCIDMSGVGELDHLARSIRRNSNIIRPRGKKPNLEYRLVGPGRPMTIEYIKKLAKGETIK